MNDLSAKEAWRAVLGELQLQLPKPTFETWLKQTEGIGCDSRRFVVAVPTAFAIAWLERRMYQVIQRTLEKVTGEVLDIHFQVGMTDTAVSEEVEKNQFSTTPEDGVPNEEEAFPAAAPAEPEKKRQARVVPNLNHRYTFDSFVVGSSNRLAYSAARAVSDAPGQSYNPLFIYSGVGLGKTHLLHAIGHTCNDKGMSVLYVSSEQFTNDFISAIRSSTTEAFRERYRTVEVLLIDDIQFMSGKDQTQEVFFHTFNDLHNAGSQIVMTSDRPPQSLALLEDRLRSRFEWGLIADIQPPDLETRMAILAAKAEELKVSLDERIIELIAKRVQKNVRELEGSLKSMVAHSQLSNVPITLESTSVLLDELTAGAARASVDPERIIEEVSRHYKVSSDDIIGPRRTKKVAQARQVAMYLLIYELGMSTTDVGRMLGGRDHSTAIHGAGKINGEINEDNRLRQDVLTIKEAIFT